MIVTLAEAKDWLRVEQGFTEEDGLITRLIAAAEQYLVNATGQTHDATNELAKLFVMVLVSEWYENRDVMGRVTEQIRMRPAVQSMLAQLTYCTPATDGGSV